MFTIYSADVISNPSNCSYPHRQVILDEAGLKAAISRDYVCAEYKNNYRSKTVVRNAFVYIMHEERPLGLPSGSYVRTCLEGYSNFGFDESVLLSALENSRKGQI